MDQIVALDVVLANGTYLQKINEKNSGDIYYAMRGAADSIGIATTFYLKTQPAPLAVTNFNIDASDAMVDIDSAVKAFTSIQDLVMGKRSKGVIDSNLAFGWSFSRTNMRFDGVYIGSLAKFKESTLPALLKDLPKTTEVTATQMTWLESLQDLNDGEPLSSGRPYVEHGNFFAKSVVVPEPGVPKKALETYFDFLINTDESNVPIPTYAFMDLYGGIGSKINTKDSTFSAFGHRDSLWVAQHYGYVDNSVEFPGEGIDYINALNDALSSNVPNYSAYENYVDPSLTRQEAHSLYYGDVLYKKLQAMKKNFDPDNLFWNPQSI